MESISSRNYLKIYFWRSISIISGFLSLLIVVPHLSNNKELYGIYTFCISFTLYLTYADIGFLGAGQKYAAESFARGNRVEEIKILGFTGAILLLMIIPFSTAMIYFSFNPSLLINGLSHQGQRTAGDIFLIIGLLSPFQVIIQRLVQSILIIRIKDFVSLRIDIIFNLIKIASVFFFFSKGRYLVVEYFFFSTILTILSCLVILIIIKKTENYDFIQLIKSIRFSKKYYRITKKLAFSSLFLTVGWLLYYELDIIIIGKWYGPKDVAIYAIGFTFLNFLRTLWNTVFTPYAQRFNHYSGTNSMLEMKQLTTKIIDYTFPLCAITTLTLALSAKYIVWLWVGEAYNGSIVILQLLIVGTGFGFIIQPASYYFMAKTKYSFINILAVTVPASFILGILTLNSVLGISAFALSKSLAMFISFIVSIIGLRALVNPISIMSKWFLNLSVLYVALILLLPKLLDYLFTYPDKNTMQLASLLSVLGILVVLSYCLVLITKKQQRQDIRFIFNKIKRNLQLEKTHSAI